jgi:FkbM family methyltransferase
MVKVSICIPAYNQPDCLRRTLESIRSQSYHDYEVIITDDSTNSLVQEVAQQFLSDSRYQYYKNVKRKGTPGNWNEGIRHAKGSLIKLLHHDDWFIDGDSLAEYVRLLDEKPEANLAFSAAVAFDSAQHRLFVHQPSASQIAELTEEPGCLFWGNFVGAPSATIFRRQDNMYFDEQLKWLVDIEFYIRMLNQNPHFAFSERPIIGITAVSDHQVTTEVAKDMGLQLRENLYVYEKLKLPFSRRLGAIKLFRSLFAASDVTSVEALQGYFTKNLLPFEIRMAIYHEKMRVFLARVASLPKRALSRWAPDPKLKPQISYSQCGEDLIVSFIFMWLKIKEVTYLDIGAHHPTWLSNTYLFYRNGFRGVLVEADPYLHAQLQRKRPRDLCLSVGIGIGDDREADFYVMTTRTLNTFSREEAHKNQSYGNEKIEQTIRVPLVSVNEIIQNNFMAPPNFVSLDVEGLDLKILQDFDFERCRPEVFCIETLTYTEDNSERKIEEIIDFMRSKNYFVYADTFINTIFVDKEKWLKRK